MKLPFLDYEKIAPHCLARYTIPLRKGKAEGGGGAERLIATGYKSSGYCLNASVVDITEMKCKYRDKAYYEWTWRAIWYFGNRNVYDNDGKLLVWNMLTDTIYHEGATLKKFLDSITEHHYSLSEWQAAGLDVLIGRQFMVRVDAIYHDKIVLTDWPEWGKRLELRGYGNHVTGASLLNGEDAILDGLVKAAISPPVPTAVIMNVDDLDDTDAATSPPVTSDPFTLNVDDLDDTPDEPVLPIVW